MHKANEKFSGKGHSAHICKDCDRLSPAEKSEAIALTRLYSLPVSRLNDGDKKWLENRTHDKRPAVKQAALKIYRQHFPYAQRNAMKKQLRIDRMEFTVDTILCDDNWEELPIQCSFVLERNESILCLQELHENTAPLPLGLTPKETAQLLKWMLHSLEIFCWDEDYCSVQPESNIDFDLSELPGFEGVAQSNINDGAADTPSWSIRLNFADGQEQYMECFELGLPERVEELYRKLNGYFYDEDEDEFDFIELAYDCADLAALEQLVSHLLADASEIQSDDLLAMALMELTMTQNKGQYPPKPGERPYHTYSGASANIQFLRSFLTQAWAHEKERSANGVERLRQFSEYVRANLTQPCGELVSNSDLDKIMAALEKRYGLISRLSQTGTLQVLRISNSHRTVNSVCNAAKPIDGTDSFRYELYLFHCRDENAGHPAYILLHEIGHALQVELTHNPEKIPESFCKMSDVLLGKPLEQGILAPEIFADAFAIGMIRIFGWDAYGTFDTLSSEVKHVFANYMHWLLETEIAKRDPLSQ